MKEIQTHAQLELIPGPMDLLNLSGQYTFGETNRISRLKISGGVILDQGSELVQGAWTFLGYILGRDVTIQQCPPIERFGGGPPTSH